MPYIKTIYRPYLLLVMLSILLQLMPESVRNHLVYQRIAIEQGEWWRLLTGHILHTNYWHLLLNLLGLLFIMSLHARHQRYLALIWQLLFHATFISLALYFWQPQILTYVGLSGVLHALLCWGAIMDIRGKDYTGWLLLAGITGKVGWEQFQGADPELEQLISAAVAIDAHWYGLLSGILLAAVTFIAHYCRTAIRQKNLS